MFPELSRRYICFGWISVTAVLIAVVLGIVFSTGSMLGQASAEAPSVTRDEINAVARELWCPLCSGVRLDSCELKACSQMRDVIAIKLSEGEDTETIKSYFVEQYGPQVLGEPPREGFNWLAWILPIVALLGGGVFMWNRVRHMMAGRDSETMSAEENSAPAGANNDADQTGEDAHKRKLEEELARYG